MYICKKCGDKVWEFEAIKYYYIIEKNGDTGEFIDDSDGFGANGGYKCSKCGIEAKRLTMRALKRIAIWID